MKGNKKDERLYQTLLSYLSNEDRKRLLTLDAAIKMIEDTIYKQSGWWRTPRGYMLQDNFRNEDDPEFMECDTYMIYRNENGYYPRTDSKPFNEHFRERNDKERAFFYKYQELLQQLHLLLSEKERLLSSECTLKDEASLEDFTRIAIHLGYLKEEKVPTK